MRKTIDTSFHVHIYITYLHALMYTSVNTVCVSTLTHTHTHIKPDSPLVFL